jgi:hypothetical protein
MEMIASAENVQADEGVSGHGDKRVLVITGDQDRGLDQPDLYPRLLLSHTFIP